jgi:hypothetical protein
MLRTQFKSNTIMASLGLNSIILARILQSRQRNKNREEITQGTFFSNNRKQLKQESGSVIKRQEEDRSRKV